MRFFLESVSEVSVTGFIASDAPTIVHYALFYIGLALSLILVLKIFQPDGRKIEKIALFGTMAVWLPPILGFVVAGGYSSPLTYASFGPIELLRSAFGVGLAPASGAGVAISVKIELILTFAGIGAYIWFATKKFLKVFLAVALSFAVVFLWGSAPGLLRDFHDLFVGAVAGVSPPDFLVNSASGSLAAQNFLHPLFRASYLGSLITLFNIAISQVYYLVVLALSFVYFYLHHREKLTVILKNSRMARMAAYWTVFFAGMFVAWEYAPHKSSFGWLDVISLVVLLATFYFGRMFAVGLNDVADAEIDKISNRGRPIPSSKLGVEDIKNANVFFLASCLLGGFLSGSYIFFVALVSIAIVYIYSVPPLRLRNFPILSSFLISLICAALIVSGFYFLSADKNVSAFQFSYLVLMILGFTLAANVKDIKDVEGDRAGGVGSLLVVFGEERGKKITGAMLAAALLLVPLVLWEKILVIPSIAGAAAGYYFVNRAPYKEKYIFVLYFLYAATAFVLMSLK